MSTSTTEIAWTDRTWNPTRGCSRVSEGCRHCYAEGIAYRFSGPGKPFEGLAHKANGHPAWTGKVVTVDSALLEPLSWRKPCRVFVNSMSDLFHEDVPFSFIDHVFAIMALAPRHTFQVLTKRAKRMREYFAVPEDDLLDRWADATMEQELPLDDLARDNVRDGADRDEQETFSAERHWSGVRNGDFPLKNVWLGVSAEDQQRLEDRIGPLCQTPAFVRFLSLEPLLGSIDFSEVGGIGPLKAGLTPAVPGIDWVIVGGESGPGARPCDLAWVRSIVEQCKAAGVACFVKQLGAFPLWRLDNGTQVNGEGGSASAARAVGGMVDSKGGEPLEWPPDLRVRQFPEVRA